MLVMQHQDGGYEWNKMEMCLKEENVVYRKMVELIRNYHAA